MSALCEDYPCCGHNEDDPCAPQWYDAPDAFDPNVNPHCFCEHEFGICEADIYEDDEDADPETCEHGDTSYHVKQRGDEVWYVKRDCDRCYTSLPDLQETDPEIVELYRWQ
jgi:hypothetical protein